MSKKIKVSCPKCGSENRMVQGSISFTGPSELHYICMDCRTEYGKTGIIKKVEPDQVNLVGNTLVVG